MWTALVILHVLVGVALILIVLLQTGKGADMGAAFGGSSQTLFGSAGPGTFLGKLTTAAAVIFMCTSLALAFMSTGGHRGGESVMQGAGAGRPPAQHETAPPVGPSPGQPGPLMDRPAQGEALAAPQPPQPATQR